MKLILASTAVRDLQSIAEYGRSQFGTVHTTQYIRRVRQALGLLIENPHLWRLHEFTEPPIRRYVCGSHAIFYDERPDSLLIVRILHHSQDHPAHITR